MSGSTDVWTGGSMDRRTLEGTKIRRSRTMSRPRLTASIRGANAGFCIALAPYTMIVASKGWGRQGFGTIAGSRSKPYRRSEPRRRSGQARSRVYRAPARRQIVTRLAAPSGAVRPLSVSREQVVNLLDCTPGGAADADEGGRGKSGPVPVADQPHLGFPLGSGSRDRSVTILIEHI